MEVTKDSPSSACEAEQAVVTDTMPNTSNSKRKLITDTEADVKNSDENDDLCSEGAGHETSPSGKKPKLEEPPNSVSNEAILEESNEGQLLLAMHEETASCNNDQDTQNQKNEKEANASESGSLCSFCGFMAKNPTALKIHLKRKHSNGSSSACTSTADTSPGSKSHLLKDNTRAKSTGKPATFEEDASFESCTAITSNEKHKVKNANALEEHIKQNLQQMKVFTCDLCCFQCIDEESLHSHFLGKTHLRRQNLAEKRENLLKQQSKKLTERQIRANAKKIRQKNTPVSVGGGNEKPLPIDLIPSDTDYKNGKAIQKRKVASTSKQNKEPRTGYTKLKRQTEISKGMAHVNKAMKRNSSTREIPPLADDIISNQENFNREKPMEDCTGEMSPGLKNTLKKGLKKKEKETEQKQKNQVSTIVPVELVHKMVSDTPLNKKPTCSVVSGESVTLSEENEEAKLQAAESSSQPDFLKTHDKCEVRSSGLKPALACSYCSRKFKKKWSLEIHVESCQSKQMPFYCQLCLFSCLTKNYFEKHLHTFKHKCLKAVTFRGRLGKKPKEKRTFDIQVAVPEVHRKPSLIRSLAINLLKRSAKLRTWFRCKNCPFKTKSSTIVMRHIRLKHAKVYTFYCRVCSVYMLTQKGMDKHIKRKCHRHQVEKSNLGLSFEEIVEEVCVNVPKVPKTTSTQRFPPSACSSLKGSPSGKNSTRKRKNNVSTTSKSKRGRPKENASTTCSHCGLVASTVTNLSVHIRRRHSHQYSFFCKICKYYSVTKGDMDRHCATKKHAHRAEIAKKENDGKELTIQDGFIELLHSGMEGKTSDAMESTSRPTKDKTSKEIVDTDNGKQKEVVTSQLKGEIKVGMAPGTNTSHDQNVADNQEKSDEGETDENKNDHSLLSPPQKKARGELPNSCAHCDFVAHSCSSLDLHIKRKHTKDFEYFCMACNYYAVTRREISRHAATEKHRLKSLSYLQVAKDKETKPFVENVESEGTTQEGETTATDREDFTSCSSDLDTEKMDVGIPENELNGSKESLNMTPTKKGETIGVFVDTQLEQEGRSDENTTNSSNIDSQPTTTDALYISSDVISDSYLVPSNGDTGHNEPVVRGDEVDGTQKGKNSDEEVDSQEEPTVEKALLDAQQEAETAVKDSMWRTNESVSDSSQQTSNDLQLPGSRYIYNVQNKELSRAVPFDDCIVQLKNSSDTENTDSDRGLCVETSAPSAFPCDTNLQQVKRKRKTEKSLQTESARIRCEDCGFLADGLSGLNVHISMKHPSKEKYFHCLLCGKSFYTESNLHQHLTSVGHLRNEQASVEELPEGGATFKCVKCNDPFESEQDLFMHIKEKHEELLREVNKYILEDTEQINKEREENQGSVCKYCGKICKSSNSMAFLAHVRTHTGSKPFKCKLCNFATAQLGDARNHVKRHLGMREYKCHVCGWAFVMKKHLNTHLLGKHGVGTPKERKFECKLCERSFSEKWALNNHMKLHTGQKPFKCSWPTCHYSFLTLSGMKDHYRTHTGEKSFLCDLCGFAGGTRHALTKHRRQHTGEKPFKCDLCNFASTTQSHLTRHKRVHTGEKPYRCPWCDYRSNCAENIRKHILHTGKHEGVKMYNCPKCDYGTNAPMDFRNHLKETHPDIENPDLAYLHAGIVSKSFECRLKGQGATFVQTDDAFLAANEEPVPASERAPQVSRKRQTSESEPLQQVIIIQGLPEESAAATLQTLAMAGQVAEVVHITEDGQVITTSGNTAHMSNMIPSQIRIPAGTTQVVVVETPMEASEDGQEMLPRQDVAIQGAPSASALDALLCAVTEIGAMKDRLEQQGDSTVGPEDEATVDRYETEGSLTNSSSNAMTEAIHIYQEAQEGTEPMEVVTQVVQSSEVPSPQGSAPLVYKDVVQGVVQFAVCDMATAGHLMEEGVTRVIVNNEGTVHMVARDGPQLIMQEESGSTVTVPSEDVDMVSSDREISQIIVTEEIARAMVEGCGQTFTEGSTHYIVTELGNGALEVKGAMYSEPGQDQCQEEGYTVEDDGGNETVESNTITTAVVEETVTDVEVFMDGQSQEHIPSHGSDAVE
ncbi:zinc finger protein 407 [Erpetoichthys calabaricus]|uniref:zinc finger protein 407 n=1 Tax=Erpetoichthys calabaricus TaxID=27687 RepID=UPI00223411A0|nr:zinc finger protein 407 [Erpetoichthys calabaricus]